MKLRVKRIYESPASEDGFRVLVDRLWPRGISKESAKLDAWMRELAPSTVLRKSYCHDVEHWDDFCTQYEMELAAAKDAIDDLVERARTETVTLLFASRELERNNAVALKQIIERRRTSGRR